MAEIICAKSGPAFLIHIPPPVDRSPFNHHKHQVCHLLSMTCQYYNALNDAIMLIAGC